MRLLKAIADTIRRFCRWLLNSAPDDQTWYHTGRRTGQLPPDEDE
jgi:hypothetical protein